MNPSDLYAQTLSQLGATELSLTSPQGSALIQASASADHQQAMELLLDVHQARLALANAALSSIAGKLSANEAALTAGTAAVKAVLQRLDNLAQILTTVGNLIDTVGKIVPMV